jgi:hypothetical protein
LGLLFGVTHQPFAFCSGKVKAKAWGRGVPPQCAPCGVRAPPACHAPNIFFRLKTIFSIHHLKTFLSPFSFNASKLP